MRLIIAFFVIVIIYLVQKLIFIRLWDRRLKIGIYFDRQYAECGEEVNLIEAIDNAKLLPLPVIHIKFAVTRTFLFKDVDNMAVTDMCHRNDAFSVMGYRRITRKIPFKACARGYFGIEGANIIIRDFFMTQTFARPLPKAAELYVFPEKVELGGFEVAFNRLVGELYSKRSLYEDPFSFRGIRDYTRNDTMRHINWKRSAKSGELMVNLYTPAADEEVRIMINFDTDSMIKTDILMEKSISLASTLAGQLIEKRIPVSIMSNGTDIVTGEMEKVDAGAGNTHMLTVDRYLSRISGVAERKENNGSDIKAVHSRAVRYGTLKNSEFYRLLMKELELANDRISYIIISAYHKEDLTELLDRMQEKGISVNLLVPYYDVYGFRPERDYITGWEVELNEA